MWLRQICVALVLVMLMGCDNVTNARSSAETNHHAQETPEISSESGEYTTVIYDHKRTRIPTTNGEVPVLAVLSACGISFVWIDDDSAEFEWNGRNYHVSISSHEITSDDSTYNHIQIPPGGDGGHISSHDNEIYVDFVTMKGILFTLKISAIIRHA